LASERQLINSALEHENKSSMSSKSFGYLFCNDFVLLPQTQLYIVIFVVMSVMS